MRILIVNHIVRKIVLYIVLNIFNKKYKLKISFYAIYSHAINIPYYFCGINIHNAKIF